MAFESPTPPIAANMEQDHPWTPGLLAVLMRLAQLRREPLDANFVQSVLQTLPPPDSARIGPWMQALTRALNLPRAKRITSPEQVHLPLLMVTDNGFGIVSARNPTGGWSVLRPDSATGALAEDTLSDLPDAAGFFKLVLQQRYIARKSPSLRLIASEVLAERKGLAEIIAGSVFVSIVALVTSLYSMQVYDRVIPTGAAATLLVLTLGALVAGVLDTAVKWSRAQVVADISDRIDQRLARSVYARFLGVRLDAMPASVGIMAQRMRSYEGVRHFIIGTTSSFIVDVPLALFLLLVLAAIGGSLALIPLVFLLLSVVVALFVARRIEDIARKALPAHNLKTGHLVESVEGAEIIKAGNGSWRMLARWLDLTDQARGLDHRMKNMSEGFSFLIGLFQQLAYILLIALGALSAGVGTITMGGLIACSILSGRIMSPLAALANVIVQWANTKASLQDLDRFWQLGQDYDDVEAPLLADALAGNYLLTDVAVEYGGLAAVTVDSLSLSAGETVVILGPIGSGKSTLLKVLSGLYRPRRGRITLDFLNLAEINKGVLAENVGFVPQDGRLFAGTLRDNLIIGMTDPGDKAILEAATTTGLFQSVIAPHPKGLAREINEGGHGLSGGQRQLVHITRAILRRPRVWLLDEPTAAMDGQSEARVIAALQDLRRSDPSALFVFVTHKPQIATLATRIIVLQGGKIVLDGSRDAVLRQLSGNPAQAAQTAEVA